LSFDRFYDGLLEHKVLRSKHGSKDFIDIVEKNSKFLEKSSKFLEKIQNC